MSLSNIYDVRLVATSVYALSLRHDELTRDTAVISSTNLLFFIFDSFLKRLF
jgi:hypothetical protein